MKQMVLWFGVMAAVVVLGFGCGKKPTEPSGPTVNLATLADSMILIQGGTFTMGDTTPYGNAFERPLHQVTVSSFYMSATECTQRKFRKVMGSLPPNNTVNDSFVPVVAVNWYRAVRFCNALSRKEGKSQCYDTSNADSSKWECDFTKSGYRLPTEAEWEYACRAGTTTNTYWGIDPMDGYATWDHAWLDGNSNFMPHRVAGKGPNAWGLYEMMGNTWEWCNDWYVDYKDSAQVNPTGPNSGTSRIIRGSSADGGLSEMRSGLRWMSTPEETFILNETDYVGIRVVCGLEN